MARPCRCIGLRTPYSGFSALLTPMERSKLAKRLRASAESASAILDRSKVAMPIFFRCDALAFGSVSKRFSRSELRAS
jgi:hypothetical protein